MIRLYEEVVGRGGVSPGYFFDRMSINECAAFMRGMNRREQEEWERTRMIMYVMAQVNSTKSLTPETLFPFPWDEEQEPVEIDENDLKELRERAKSMEYGE